MQLSQLHRFRHVRRSKKTCASPSSFELELRCWGVHIILLYSRYTRSLAKAAGWNTCFPFAPRGRLFCALFLAKLKCTLRASVRVAPAELLRASGSIRRCRPLAHTPQKRNQRTEGRSVLLSEKTGNVSACSCRDCECR